MPGLPHGLFTTLGAELTSLVSGVGGHVSGQDATELRSASRKVYRRHAHPPTLLVDLEAKGARGMLKSLRRHYGCVVRRFDTTA